MARIEVTAENFPGSALIGSGTDTLVLIGGGDFDFDYVTISGFSQIVLEGGYYSEVRISGEQLAGIMTINSTTSSNSLYLTGSEIDLTGKALSNFSGIYIDEDDATVTVSSLSLALTLNARNRQGETIILDGPITTPTSRADLHNLGFDKIVQGTNEWTNASPTLTGLEGNFYVREGDTVRLDPEGDATIADAEGPIDTLNIALSGSGRYFPMSNFEIGTNFKILDNSFDQTLLYKDTTIATITRVSFGDEAQIKFNANATADIINEFVRNLAFDAGDYVYYENVTVTVTAYDKGGRKAESVLHVNAEKNWTPTQPTLTGKAVLENAAAGTVVGTLRATDANDDPINYRLLDDAGGRFIISGDKLIVSGKVPIDYEQASQFTVKVVANDGEKDGIASTFTIQVTNLPEGTDPATPEQPKVHTGGKAKDNLVGAGGQDILNGGLGNDVLTGGGGKDIFIFNGKPGKTNIDVITDFSPKQDMLQLENAIFKNLGKTGTLKKGAFYAGSKAHDKDDRIIYNKKLGMLSYDPDGTGSAAAVQFAKLTNKPDLKYTDLFVI